MEREFLYARYAYESDDRPDDRVWADEEDAGESDEEEKETEDDEEEEE